MIYYVFLTGSEITQLLTIKQNKLITKKTNQKPENQTIKQTTTIK